MGKSTLASTFIQYHTFWYANQKGGVETMINIRFDGDSDSAPSGADPSKTYDIGDGGDG